jgi:hypothetical protein
MTVRELITILKKMPQNIQVHFRQGEVITGAEVVQGKCEGWNNFTWNPKGRKKAVMFTFIIEGSDGEWRNSIHHYNEAP